MVASNTLVDIPKLFQCRVIAIGLGLVKPSVNLAWFPAIFFEIEQETKFIFCLYNAKTLMSDAECYTANIWMSV